MVKLDFWCSYYNTPSEYFFDWIHPYFCRKSLINGIWYGGQKAFFIPNLHGTPIITNSIWKDANHLEFKKGWKIPNSCLRSVSNNAFKLFICMIQGLLWAIPWRELPWGEIFKYMPLLSVACNIEVHNLKLQKLKRIMKK